MRKRYLALLPDPKPITVRQCAQALPNVLRDKPERASEVGQAITRIDLMTYKGTMLKRILIDFLDALLVWKTQQTLDLREYFLSLRDKRKCGRKCDNKRISRQMRIDVC